MQLPKRKLGKYTKLPTDHVMSKKKYRELECELEKLKQKQPYASQEVSRLAELGDFSENVEYQLAKRRLRGILSGILKLNYRINHAEIVEAGNNNIVELGSIVTIKTDKGKREYTILGASEADPENGIISHQSPLGAGLLGHCVGDVIEIDKIGRCEVLKLNKIK